MSCFGGQAGYDGVGTTFALSAQSELASSRLSKVLSKVSMHAGKWVQKTGDLLRTNQGRQIAVIKLSNELLTFRRT